MMTARQNFGQIVLPIFGQIFGKYANLTDGMDDVTRHRYSVSRLFFWSVWCFGQPVAILPQGLTAQQLLADGQPNVDLRRIE